MAVQPFGLNVPTSNVWDVERLYDIDVNTPEFKELLVRLYQNLNNICIVLNLKDSAYYNTDEFVNGQQWFPNPALSSATQAYPDFRAVFRLVINFGALPNAGLKSVPHGIVTTPGFTFTRIYATASDPIGRNYIPIPYASPILVNNIELNVDAVNVNITTGSNRTNFTTTYVILEYLKF